MNCSKEWMSVRQAGQKPGFLSCLFNSSVVRLPRPDFRLPIREVSGQDQIGLHTTLQLWGARRMPFSIPARGGVGSPLLAMATHTQPCHHSAGVSEMAGPVLCLSQHHRDPVVTADTLLSHSRWVSWAVGLVLGFLQAEC